MLHKLGLGTVQFGMPYGISRQYDPPGLDEISSILRLAQQYQITTLDTASSYGESEVRLGQCLEDTERKPWQIFTKVSASETLSTVEMVHQSCQRLQEHTLAGVLLHSFEEFKAQPARFEDLLSLKMQGKIEGVGVSLYHPEEAEYLLASAVKPDLIQIPYNLFDRRFEYLFPALKRAGITLHVRSVFLQGLLLMLPNQVSEYFAEIRPLLATLQDWHQAHDLHPSWLPLHFVFRNPAVDRVIVGVEREFHLQQLIDNLRIQADMSREMCEPFEVQNPAIILPFMWNA